MASFALFDGCVERIWSSVVRATVGLRCGDTGVLTSCVVRVATQDRFAPHDAVRDVVLAVGVVNLELREIGGPTRGQDVRCWFCKLNWGASLELFGFWLQQYRNGTQGW